MYEAEFFLLEKVEDLENGSLQFFHYIQSNFSYYLT